MLKVYRKIKEVLRDKFYDNVEVGGSFTLFIDGRIVDIIHVVGLTCTEVTYKRTWYGYEMSRNTTISRKAFKYLVAGRVYYGKDYLYSL